MRKSPLLWTAIISMFWMAACTPQTTIVAPPPEPTQSVSQQTTAIVQTLAVRQTISSLETQISASTATPTTGPVPPTNTPRPVTATPQATATIRFNTATPFVLSTPLAQVPCNSAAFVSDVTIPDGMVLAADQTFIKTWRIKNVGSCGWTTAYSVVFSNGDQLGAPAAVNFPVGIKPGETIDLSVPMVAPKTDGNYKGFWQLRSADEESFGTGTKNQPFYVAITVGTPGLTGLQFAYNFCSAVWKNGKGTGLPCPGSKADFTTGSIQRIDNPTLEGGTVDDEPALVMIPNDGSGGLVSGRFPAFTVQSGDHFVSLVGCMNNSPKCVVTFKLSYTTDGGATVTDLKAANESSDGNKTPFNVDLSSLAGKSVQLILIVGNKDGTSTDDQAFWLNPLINR